jgi:hypothetical protein
LQYLSSIVYSMPQDGQNIMLMVNRNERLVNERPCNSVINTVWWALLFGGMR